MNSYPMLKSRLLQLKAQAEESDKSRHIRPKFNPALFQCRANTLTPYVSEALNLLRELHQMSTRRQGNVNRHNTALFLSDKLVDQIEAIKKVLDGEYLSVITEKVEHTKPVEADDLYLALEQHKEWERRLTLALHQKEKWYRSLPEGQKTEAKAVVVTAAERLLRCQESRQQIESQIGRPTLSESDLNLYNEENQDGTA